VSSGVDGDQQRRHGTRTWFEHSSRMMYTLLRSSKNVSNFTIMLCCSSRWILISVMSCVGTGRAVTSPTAIRATDARAATTHFLLRARLDEVGLRNNLASKGTVLGHEGEGIALGETALYVNVTHSQRERCSHALHDDTSHVSTLPSTAARVVAAAEAADQRSLAGDGSNSRGTSTTHTLPRKRPLMYLRICTEPSGILRLSSTTSGSDGAVAAAAAADVAGGAAYPALLVGTGAAIATAEPPAMLTALDRRRVTDEERVR
jgi:hypothetical protein